MQSKGWQRQVEVALEAAAEMHGRPTWDALGEGVGGARWSLRWGGERWFVKSGDAEVLAAEADGLAALAAAGALRTPQLIASGDEEGEGYIVLEWLVLARDSSGAGARLGEALARQHLRAGESFGWTRHNFIGATPQFNTASADWIKFFREQRLGFQLRLAAEDGHHGELQQLGARLAAELPRFFTGHSPKPALLHGDLWSGNRGVLADGGPVVFDPAVYWGDREADLAMTELFGGFGAEFYAAYRAHAPLDPGYRVRRELYNLYHVLNHANLFGRSFAARAHGMIERLLAELHG